MLGFLEFELKLYSMCLFAIARPAETQVWTPRAKTQINTGGVQSHSAEQDVGKDGHVLIDGQPQSPVILPRSEGPLGAGQRPRPHSTHIPPGQDK